MAQASTKIVTLGNRYERVPSAPSIESLDKSNPTVAKFLEKNPKATSMPIYALTPMLGEFTDRETFLSECGVLYDAVDGLAKGATQVSRTVRVLVDGKPVETEKVENVSKATAIHLRPMLKNKVNAPVAETATQALRRLINDGLRSGVQRLIGNVVKSTYSAPKSGASPQASGLTVEDDDQLNA
jgi:hypothetical protein